MIIVSILFLLIAIVAGIAAALSGKLEYNKLPAIITAGVTGFIAIASLFFASYNTVAANEVAVPITFGHTGAELGAGVHFLNPFTKLVSFPTVLQDYRMSANSSEGNKSGNDSVQLIGSDHGQVSVDVDVNYVVKDPTKVYHTLGSLERIDDVFIRGNVRPAIAAAAGKLDSNVLLSAIADIRPDVEAQMAPLFTANGLELKSIQFRTPVPGENLQAKLKAQQDVQAAEAAQKRAAVEADTAVIQARGQAKAAEILGAAIDKFPAVTCNTFVQGELDGKISSQNNFFVCPGAGSGKSPSVIVSQPPAK